MDRRLDPPDRIGGETESSLRLKTLDKRLILLRTAIPLRAPPNILILLILFPSITPRELQQTTQQSNNPSGWLAVSDLAPTGAPAVHVGPTSAARSRTRGVHSRLRPAHSRCHHTS